MTQGGRPERKRYRALHKLRVSKNQGSQNTTNFTMILTVGTPKTGPRIFGSSQFVATENVPRAAHAVNGSNLARPQIF